MNYYNLLGLQSMLANPFEYARVNFINSLYQTPYQTSLQYQNPYQVALSNLFLPSYYDPLSTLLGSFYYQDPVTQLLGQYTNPFLLGNPSGMSPDYSTKMYVIGTTDISKESTIIG